MDKPANETKMLEELEEFLLTVRSEIEENYPNLRETVAQWFAYAILYKQKYIVDHDDDPNWDSSGSLRLTRKAFSIDSYKSLEDFLSEYTGQSNASFLTLQWLAAKWILLDAITAVRKARAYC